MAIDVRSKQSAGVHKVDGGTPGHTAESLGKQLWKAFTGLVERFTAPVPKSTRPAVMNELGTLLGAKDGGVAGSLTDRRENVKQAERNVVDDAGDRVRKNVPLQDWTNSQVTGTLEALDHVQSGIARNRLENDMFNLPKGTTLHEDGHVLSTAHNAPAHLNVVKAPYMRDVFETAHFLVKEALRTGKPQAMIVNNALLEVITVPGGDTKAAAEKAREQWGVRRQNTTEQNALNQLEAMLRPEFSRRLHEPHLDVREKTRQQIAALPPNTRLYASSLDAIRDLATPNTTLKQAPWHASLDEAIPWIAAAAHKYEQPVAYNFNGNILLADPSKGDRKQLERDLRNQFENRI